jgi:diguanylate cyclase (GGDEF)-like protein
MENTNTRSSSSSQGQGASARPYLMVIGGARVGALYMLARERNVVGRGPEAQIRLGDTGVSREHAELVVEGGRVSVRDLGSTNGTYLNGERAQARELRDGDKLSVGEATLLLFTHQDAHHDGFEASYQRGRFRSVIMRDPATAALKREIFVERLVEEVSFSRRHASPLAVLAWELDGFAALGRRLGPVETRRTLAAVTRAALAVLLEDDLLAALGGGQFGVACRETNARQAEERAAHLRTAVAATTFGSPSALLTASVGVALCGPGADKTAVAAEALLSRARAALDTARAGGGDRVEIDATGTDPQDH